MADEKKSSFSYERKNAWLNINQSKKNQIEHFSDDYKDFLNQCKTERETVIFIQKELDKMGFKPIEQAEYRPGERIYQINDQKNIVLAIIGKEDLLKGFNLVAGHIDCPRLDLKPLPLVEENEVALLKTHYYGGIKKYHWLNIPLALHGTVIKSDGTTLNIAIGESDDDPVFTIPDLLIHLSRKIQGEKKIFEGVEGENLNLVIGSIPVDDDSVKERVKETILIHLNEKYGLIEEDFISAEFEVVPAYKAKDVGLDRSLIGGFGHDDRLCSYASYRALIDIDGIPEKTSVALLIDKEEIGSYGFTGVTNRFFEDFINNILELKNEIVKTSDIRETLNHSYALSADVSAVVNPMFPGVHDLKNAAKIGHGVVLEKYSGSRGKYGGSDASAEIMGKVRKIFNDANIVWQPGTLGKVDEGGGGTIAFEIAEMGIRVVDCGAGLMGMHTPFELASKADIFETYRAYKAFLESK